MPGQRGQLVLGRRPLLLQCRERRANQRQVRFLLQNIRTGLTSQRRSTRYDAELVGFESDDLPRGGDLVCYGGQLDDGGYDIGCQR